MIQQYLNEQFIKTTEDTNFEKLKKTCADIAKEIGKDKSKILTYSLIAFDPEVPADNENIVEIKNQIIENWPTFVSNTKDTSLTIIRAIMLDALQTSSKNMSNASLIWFATRNVFKYFRLGREKDLLTKFLLELGNKIESEASESWKFSPDDKIEVPKITSIAINPDELAKTTATNGYVTASGLAEAINKTLKKQITQLKDNQKNFADLVCLMQMRTQLLWWKEAGYSPLQKGSYKKIDDGQLQVLLAFDYSDFIPEMYPVSVDYFLLETHKGLSGNADKKIKISEFLKMVEQSSSDIKKVLPEFEDDTGRISFVSFINGLIHGKYKAKKIKSLVGIDDTNELTLGEITLWLFHDLHSIKLSNSK